MKIKLNDYIKKLLREAYNPHQDRIDALLDKVAEVGYENLTPREKNQLNNLSQNKEPDEDLDVISNFGQEEEYSFGFSELYAHLRDELEYKFGDRAYMLFPNYHEKTIQVRKYIDERNSEMFGMIKWASNERVCYEHMAFRYKFCEEPHFFTMKWLEDFQENL